MIRLLALASLLAVAAYPTQAQVLPPRPSRIAVDQQQAKPAAFKAHQNKQRVRWSNVSRTHAKAPRGLTNLERAALLEDFLEWQKRHFTPSALSTSRP